MTLSRILSTATLLSLLCIEAAAQSEAGGARRPTWAVALPAQTKVRPSNTLPPGQSSVALSSARGECEAFQIAALGGQVTLMASALNGPGRPLTAKLYREAFVPVPTASNSEGSTGLWPDPLVPLDDPAFARFDWSKTAAQVPYVAYVELCVPRGQTPGDYRGSVRVSAVGRPDVTLPITLKVRPFELPATSTLPNTFGMSVYSIANGHKLEGTSAQAKALMVKYAQALLRHRVSAHGLTMEPLPTTTFGGRLRVDFREFDSLFGELLGGSSALQGARMTTFQLFDNTFTSFEQQTAYWQQIRDHFRRRGWNQKLFFYAGDEPKPKDYAEVAARAARVRAAGGPEALITTPYFEEIANAADILAPNINCYFPRPDQLETCASILTIDQLRAEVSPETELWWYQSCLAHGCGSGPFEDPAIEAAFKGWASYMIDHSSLRNRAMGPLAFLSGIGAELYFDTVFGFNVVTRNPWKEGLFDFGGNGDGTLFYPGSPALTGQAADAPVESLRLKHLRDGLEDYEYLKLLQARGQNALAQQVVRRWTRSAYQITEDLSAWNAAREVAAYALSRAR